MCHEPHRRDLLRKIEWLIFSCGTITSVYYCIQLESNYGVYNQPIEGEAMLMNVLLLRDQQEGMTCWNSDHLFEFEDFSHT